MIAVKSIARYVMAGLLACGLCMSSALPALADGAKDQKKAPIKATKYYKDLRKKVKKNMVALNNCVIKYMPMDGEWKPGESFFKPSDLFMCQPQLNQMESSLAELLSPDTPPLLWESKEQQEKINLGNAAAKDFYELYLAPNRYLVNLVNTDPNMVGSIIQIQNLAGWGCYVAPQLKEKLGKLSKAIDEYKSTGNKNAFLPFSKFLSYDNGNMKLTSEAANAFEDLNRHVRVVKNQRKKILLDLMKGHHAMRKMEGDLDARCAELIASCPDEELKKDWQECYRYLKDWTYKRAKYAFLDLSDYFSKALDGNHEWGKIFSTKYVTSYAPNFIPVDSDNYIEMLRETLEYYVPGSVKIVQGLGVSINGRVNIDHLE